MRTERIEPQRPFFFFFFLTPKCTRLLVADGLVLLSSFYRENILVLDIFFEALNYETIEQKKAYEVAALLGKEVSGVHFGVCVNHVCLWDGQMPQVGAQVTGIAMKSQQGPATLLPIMLSIPSLIFLLTPSWEMSQGPLLVFLSTKKG